MINCNNKYYKSRINIASELFKNNLLEDCINYIELTARFAWFNYSGYYKSNALENLIKRIGVKLILEKNIKNSTNSNKILHICSEVYEGGGHSKLLYNWILNQPQKSHSILSTRMHFDDLRNITDKYLNNKSEVELFNIKSNTKLEEVYNLVNIILNNDFEYIVLHIHPDEVVANIVLTQEIFNIPVIFVNHADHVFWLGVTSADYFLQIRSSNIEIDNYRRGLPLERQMFVPIPIPYQKIKNDINCDNIYLLSTGTTYKYTPNENYNFLNEIFKVVDKHTNVIFNVVGIQKDNPYAQKYLHERIIYHGIISIEELKKIEEITDIYVEGFPMSSFTALLQVSLQKIPFILHYKPLNIFKLFKESIENDIKYPENLISWHNEIDNLITKDTYRKRVAEKQFSFVKNNYDIFSWKKRIDDLEIKLQNFHKVENNVSEDIFVNDLSEKLLVGLDRTIINHIDFTRKLPILIKFKILFQNFKNINVEYLTSKRSKWNYILYNNEHPKKI